MRHLLVYKDKVSQRNGRILSAPLTWKRPLILGAFFIPEEGLYRRIRNDNIHMGFHPLLFS
jgi:hypothetical protein